MITVTPRANHQISQLCQENNCYAITLNLKGGGCAGFEYEWGTAQVEDLEASDFIVWCDNGALAVGLLLEQYPTRIQNQHSHHL